MNDLFAMVLAGAGVMLCGGYLGRFLASQASPPAPSPAPEPGAWQSRLQAADSYARNLIEASRDPMLFVDLAGRIVDANRAAEEVTGAARGELAGRFLSACFVQAHAVSAVLQRVLHEGQVDNCALSIQHAGGRRTEAVCGFTLHRDHTGAAQGAFAVARDVTELRQYETQMSFQATCDALTALPNRLLFREQLDCAMARADRSGRMVALLFLDLDNFKDINETLGHAIGDELLKGVAGRLSGALLGTGSAARMGGDEFAVLVENVQDAAEMEGLATRLRHAVDKAAVVDGHEVSITCSIGIALYPVDGRDPDTLLSNVDTAMYRAKKEGKNNCRYFTTEMNNATRRRVDIGNALRRSLKCGEFELHYQPRVELAGGTIVGAEALLRWTSGELGAVAPSEFIPVAESSGMIVQIGDWVLHEACQQARLWRDVLQRPVPVAVNLSARQLHDVDIVKSVMRALNDSGLPADLLELELTETMLVHDVKYVTRTLHALKEIGVRLAIDDFGTGYSSLNYLKSFPLDYLKVDQSFIKDIAHDANDEAIVRAIIALAHSLGLKVIAEGVEAGAQLCFLLAQDCDEVQGYYFSKPLAARQMQAALRELRRFDWHNADPGQVRFH